MATLKNGYIPRLLVTEYASYRDQVIKRLSSELADAQLSRSKPLVVYDPMAGTAPLLFLAERKGYTSYFNDINPLHLYVNAAKSFSAYLAFKDIGSSKLLSIICGMASKLDRYPRTGTEQWIEDSVLETLKLAWQRSDEHSKSIAVLTKTILLLAVRKFASYIRTRNPIWIKPGGLRPKVSAEQAFRSAIERLEAFYQHTYARHSAIKGGRIILSDYDGSRTAPKSKVDVVMTSPPFCNRVDWHRIYAPELFFLSAVGIWDQGTELLGTTVVKGYCDFESDFKFVTERSNYLQQFLKKVRKRQIRNERTSNYYVKYFTRYFAGLFRMFDMTARVLRKKNAGIYFVVQDSTHRGMNLDIGQALAESLSSQDFHANALEYWDRHHLGLQNVSKRYRLANPKQRESIWHAVR